jgi:tripartite-type tricarboxylate transporter receptor subunit TctC
MMCAAALASAAQAQEFPVKPIRFVSSAVGGPVDGVGRFLANGLTERFKQQVISDGRSGANGIIGTDIVAKANPDGYTMLMANSTIAIPSLSAKLPFEIRKDFIPLSLVALGPSVLVVHPSIAVNDVKGLIALAKSKPKSLSFGSGGVGNVTHLAMELLMSSAGLQMVHIPYKGGAPSVVGLVTGEVQTLFTSIPTALPQINAGKMRAIGVSISKRNVALPNVPTIAEAGVPGYEAITWNGIVAPAGMPRAMIARLNTEINRALAEPGLQQKLAAIGAEPAGGTPEDFAKFIRSEYAKWGDVVRRSGAKMD